jgi:glutaredoxin
MDYTDEEYQELYKEALLHARWVNGLNYLIEQDREGHNNLIMSMSNVLLAIANATIKNIPVSDMAVYVALVSGLNLGLYLGRYGVDAGYPKATPEYMQGVLEPLITPGCKCPACRAKLELLKEYGVEYEMTSERQELADEIAYQKELAKLIEDILPPDDFNPTIN